MNIDRPKSAMVGSAVVLGRVVGKIYGAGGPVDVELSLVGAVSEPVEPHIDGFGAVLFDGRVDDSVCSAVVGAEGRRWLWVSEFSECCSEWDSVAGVHVESTDFGFGGGSKYHLHDLGEDGDGSVNEGAVFVCKENESASPTAGTWRDKIGSV